MSNDEVSKIITIVGIITLVVLIALILVIKASGKNKADQKTMSNIAKKAKENLEIQKPQNDGFCEYCGTKHSPDERKCSSCGAPLNQKKRK